MRIKTLTIVLMLLIHFCLNAQRTVSPTDSFTVSGNVKKEKTITLAALAAFAKIAVKDQTLFNHKGEAKETVKNMKGVLLKTLLEDVEFTYDKPKELNEFYFVFIASDGYKVVFSWNELYNTEVGNHCYIITEMDGKSLNQIAQRILLVSGSDLKAGRRYIKGLQKIEVKRLD